MNARITFRKPVREKGLAAIAHPAHGVDLCVDGKRAFFIRPYGSRWYWYGGIGAYQHNTLWDPPRGTTFSTVDEAKVDAGLRAKSALDRLEAHA